MTYIDRRWREARSLADLGATAADWLEGSLPGEHPNGYDTLDPETKSLVPVLAAANRAGFITDNSQPGESGTGYDGSHYEQRAAVDGWIAPGRLLDRIRTEAKRAGLTVVSQQAGSRPRPGIPVTRANGQAVTWFATWEPHRTRTEWIWSGVGGRARRELRTTTYLTLIDPAWGPSTRLWDVLAAPSADPERTPDAHLLPAGHRRPDRRRHRVRHPSHQRLLTRED